MTDKPEVEKAVQQIEGIIKRLEDSMKDLKEMLHMENLSPAHAHAVASRMHNYESHSKQPEWSMAEGAMILCMAGVDGNHDDEYIMTAVKKTLQLTRLSAAIYDVMIPLSHEDRDRVAELCKRHIHLLAATDGTPRDPKETLH